MRIIYALILIFICLINFSCEKTEDNGNRLELLSEDFYSDNFVPEDFDYDTYMDYFDQHGEFLQVPGQILVYTINVIAKDNNGNPMQNVSINFSADGGHVVPNIFKTSADGKASATWQFDGSWGDWGAFYLTITAFEANGTTHLTGSPITVETHIVPPPGVK
ncbi:MAG: Ig-like domain-containing protein [Bacteroidales bacterium]|nr:Ig-like domain-containing protein [Bacteroidales bacterium]